MKQKEASMLLQSSKINVVAKLMLVALNLESIKYITTMPF